MLVEKEDVMANEAVQKVETFFEKLGGWLRGRFKKLPAVEVQVSSTVNYLAPVIEGLDEFVIPELAPVVNPIIDRIKTGLAALANTITDSSAAGKTSVTSVLGSLQSNAASLEAAFAVKDEATKNKVAGVLQILTGEIGSIAKALGVTL